MPFLAGWRLIAAPGYMNKHATRAGAHEDCYTDLYKSPDPRDCLQLEVVTNFWGRL
jgi:hypothetical protein